MSCNPHRYETQPGMLDDIAIPAVLRRHPATAASAAATAAARPVATGIEALVCADIAQRQALGIKKYGHQLADNPAPQRARLQHAYEEALDLANYLRWEIERIDAAAAATTTTARTEEA